MIFRALKSWQIWLGLFVVGFGVGWQVQGWRWSASEAAILKEKIAIEEQARADRQDFERRIVDAQSNTRTITKELSKRFPDMSRSILIALLMASLTGCSKTLLSTCPAPPASLMVTERGLDPLEGGSLDQQEHIVLTLGIAERWANLRTRHNALQDWGKEHCKW